MRKSCRFRPTPFSVYDRGSPPAEIRTDRAFLHWMLFPAEIIALRCKTFVNDYTEEELLSWLIQRRATPRVGPAFHRVGLPARRAAQALPSTSTARSGSPSVMGSSMKSTFRGWIRLARATWGSS